MEKDLEFLRAKFVATYSAIPNRLRTEIIAHVNDKPYNWDSANIEIIGKTEEGDKILRHLSDLKLLE